MQGIARQLRDAVNLPRAVKSEVSFLGETNLANSSAVRNLMTMARNSYVFCGARSGLERVLPGVKVHVLRVNANGEPAHPLYLPGNLKAKTWVPG